MEGNTKESSVAIFIAGDSTASNYTEDKYPRMGWGQVIGRFFQKDVVIQNHAASGRSSKSFINEGRLDGILQEIKSGDYLLIQFGHNDEKPDEERRTEPYTTYKEHLLQYIHGARKKGAHPVLLTSISRRKFNEDGTLKETHEDYPKAMKELAKEEGLPLIDMELKTKNLLVSLGDEETKKLFMWLQPGENTNYPEGEKDDTHLQEKGAIEVAKLVVEGIKERNLPIKSFLVDALK